MSPTPGNRISSMASSAGQPLRLAKRADLESKRQQYQGRDYWVVKDPITLKYYRFEEEEFALLELIDGSRSPDQIKREFDFRFAPQKISTQELSQFVGMLYRSALLVSDAPGQGLQLKQRGDEQRSAQLRQSLSNILAIRYRGFDPDRMLGVLNQWFGWFFSLPAFMLVMLMCLSALTLVIAQFDTFAQKLPSFYDFFSAQNWIWLAVVMAGTKILHEFGHGLACKRFGGQCHEMGVMLLVLMPCLYVNVSDSWLINSKWKRALIAAAGMYVELVLSAIAVFVWWFSHPGLINQLALNLVFVSSVSTVLFNANPLLRYDGYYIVSDLLEIPNLRSKATRILQRTAGQLMLGIENRPDPFLPQRNRWIFILYSLAAATYRWVITFSIFWFVYRVLEPYGFKIIGQLIALSAIYGLLGIPLIQLYRFFSVPGRLAVIKPARAAITGAILTALLVGVLAIPIPHHVYCHCYIQPVDAKNIYVDVPGSLAEIYRTQPGWVAEGEPIVGLHSYDLRVQLASLKTDVESSMTHLNNQKMLAGQGQRRTGIQAAEVALKASLANWEKRVADEQRLTVRAPIAGYFLLPPRVGEQDQGDATLTDWTGSPLDPKNLGCHLKESTLLGQVAPDPTKMEAVLAVDQEDIEFIQIDQPAELLLNQIPCKLFSSRVAIVTPTEMKATPHSLSSRYGGAIVTESGPNGQEKPASTLYLVKVPINNPDISIVAGSTGQAKIRIGSKTVGQQLWRLAQRTFQFEL